MSVDFRNIQGTVFIGPNGFYHSGIKGMKWGVRRYQNKDGSLTPAGRVRYNNDSLNPTEKERIIKEGTATEVLKYQKELSNKELNDALNRIKWTRDLKTISKKERERGWQRIDNALKKIGTINTLIATTAVTYSNVKKIKKILDSSLQK